MQLNKDLLPRYRSMNEKPPTCVASNNEFAINNAVVQLDVKQKSRVYTQNKQVGREKYATPIFPLQVSLPKS